MAAAAQLSESGIISNENGGMAISKMWRRSNNGEKQQYRMRIS